MFGLFLLFSSQHYLRLSWTFPCLFPFYLQKKALSRLLTILLGFFYRSRTKKAFCICLHLITLMLAYFTQTNFLVSLQLNWVPLSFISHNTKFILFCCSAPSFREQRCFGLNYGCSSFIAPEIVFACFLLENRFSRFSTKGSAGFGETVSSVKDRDIRQKKLVPLAATWKKRSFYYKRTKKLLQRTTIFKTA